MKLNQGISSKANNVVKDVDEESAKVRMDGAIFRLAKLAVESKSISNSSISSFEYKFNSIVYELFDRFYWNYDEIELRALKKLERISHQTGMSKEIYEELHALVQSQFDVVLVSTGQDSWVV